MSRTISQVPTLRRLARVYRRMLALAVPAALAACQGATDALAPDAAGDPSTPAAAPAAEVAAPDLLAALASDRIVFSDFTANGGADVWTMSPQGGTLAHLTTFTGVESAPTWSYDHKHIAFVRARSVGYPDIYLMDADGTHKHWARSATYAGSIDEPSWSPDGTQLLVRVAVQGNPYVGRIDLASGNLALVAPAGLFAVAGNFPIYDPKDNTILYLDNSYKTIKRFTPGGAQTTVFTSSQYLGYPALSPDGSRIAYSATADVLNSEIYVLNLATKATKRLTFNSATDNHPTWSPDGTKLAFASYRTGKMQIYTMNSTTGGSLTRITNRTIGAAWPAWVH